MFLRFVVLGITSLFSTIACGQEDLVKVPQEAARQFDFWIGDWEVVNRRIDGTGQWKDFGTAKVEVRSALGGKVIVEHWTGQGDYVLRGFSLRVFDSQADRWEVVQCWHSGRPVLFSMMTGGFEKGLGEFFPPGLPRQKRFAFSDIRRDSFQWESASLVNKKWAPNWKMEFKRTGPVAKADATSFPITLPAKYANQTYPEHRQLDRLIGNWKGAARRLKDDGSWEEGSAIRRVTAVADGFVLLQLTKFSWGEESISAIVFDDRVSTWQIVGISSDEPDFHWMEGMTQKGTLRLNESENSDNGFNNIWLNMSQDSFDWKLEQVLDSRARDIVEVSFERDGEDGRIEELPPLNSINVEVRIEQANTAIRNKRFREAESVLRNVVKYERRSAQARFLLGYTLHVQGKYEEAMDCYERTIESQRFAALSHYNIACIHSIRKNVDQAIEELRVAVDSGFDNFENIKNDADFDNIRSDTRFQAIVAGK